MVAQRNFLASVAKVYDSTLTRPEWFDENGKTQIVRTATEEQYKWPFGRPGPSPKPVLQPVREFGRGFPYMQKDYPIMVMNLKCSDYEYLFTRSPVYPETFCYIISDETAELLKSFNLGRTKLIWLGPPKDLDPSVYRGAWTLWTEERFPTLIISRFANDPNDPSLQNKIGIKTFNYRPDNLEISGGAFAGMAWDPDSKIEKWSLPCRKPETDIDLWMDPFWREGLFMSKRLVDALEAANLLEGTHDGWRMVSCREPLEQEVEQDQLQPWMRAITDEEWSAMDSQTFRDLGARARKEHKENPPPPPDPFEGMTEEAIDRAKKRQQKLFKKLGIKT